MQPRREVRRFADDVALLRFTRADEFAHDHETGGETDADFVMDAGGDQLRDGTDQGKRRPHRIFGIGLARLRIAEINQNAVAHILGDIASKACDHLGDALVVVGDDLAQIFRIEARRERRRADKIAEHHRDLSPFSRCGSSWRSRLRCGHCDRRRRGRGLTKAYAALRTKP